MTEQQTGELPVGLDETFRMLATNQRHVRKLVDDPEQLAEYVQHLEANGITPLTLATVVPGKAQTDIRRGMRLRMPPVRELADLCAVVQQLGVLDGDTPTFQQAMQTLTAGEPDHTQGHLLQLFHRRLRQRDDGELDWLPAYEAGLHGMDADDRTQLFKLAREGVRQYLTSKLCQESADWHAQYAEQLQLALSENAKDTGRWTQAQVIMAACMHDLGHLGVRIPVKGESERAPMPTDGWPWS